FAVYSFISFFFFYVPATTAIYTPFPTRRSSDLGREAISSGGQVNVLPTVPAAVTNILKFLPMPNIAGGAIAGNYLATGDRAACKDRKSTRLNSSHLVISYAVFCLKKKKKIKNIS